jgi:hypothetical protein
MKIRPLGGDLFFQDRRTTDRQTDEANSRFSQCYERAKEVTA